MPINLKHKRKKFSKEFRKKIFERDNYECQLCKKNLLLLPLKRRIDHKIPLSKGGSNYITNLWLVCEDCDKAKKNKLFKRFKKDTDIKLKKVIINNLTKKI